MNNENLIPWIIGIIVLLIVFPYDKIREYFTPQPQKVIEYVQVPQYIYIEKPVDEQNPESPHPPTVQEPVVCVFGFENVINAGNPRRCIEMCRDMGCKLAIITTSSKKTPDDIPLMDLGFTPPYFDSKDYYYNPNPTSVSFDEVAATRIEHMNSISQKHGISNPQRLILFDDNRINIEKAEESGYSTVLIGTKHPGIQEQDIRDAYEIIKKFNH